MDSGSILLTAPRIITSSFALDVAYLGTVLCQNKVLVADLYRVLVFKALTGEVGGF